MPWIILDGDPLRRRYCSLRIAFQLSRIRAIRSQSLDVFQGLFAFCGAMMGLRNEGKPMRYTDIAIVGGGLAGSTAAAMLGRAGIPAILIDPHTTYPPDLRCEKLGGTQLERCARPASPKRRCARRPLTAKSGKRVSAMWCRKNPATSTA